MTQNEALAVLKTGSNVFLTGEPGSGKTHVVNCFVAWLRERGIEPAVTASTGIAATHINGHTIHSWSGIRVKRELTKSDLDRITSDKRTVRRVRSAHTLIIDEISMLSAHTLTMVETACRSIRGGGIPFGGLQVVLVGDFFQLPPVVARDDVDKSENELFEENSANGRPLFAFRSPIWHALNLNVCYLSEQYRQDDRAFLGILSAIRSGTVSAEHRALLETRLTRQGADGVTQFFSHNADVDRVNGVKLAQLSGDARTFVMESRGPKQLVLRLTKGCLSPETLTLKVGARVMFTKNDIATHRFVNGTLGTIIGFSKEDGNPIVKTNTGRTIFAEPAEWSIEEGGRILARITQIPLRLAWAITVHKSQGMSLDAAHMDLSDAFEHGQGYVAISRVRTLAGLSLAGWNDRALEIHPEIKAIDAEFRAASRETQENFARTPAHELEKRQNDFIRACGGSVEVAAVPHIATVSKPNTYTETLALAKSGKTIKEIAAARSLTEGTIVAHLEKLRLRGELSSDDAAKLVTGQETIIHEIHVAMKSLGAGPMKPIFEHFDGRIPYDTIRLARLLFKK